MTAGRWARLLLVVATLSGLAVMHTVGHSAHPAGHDATIPVHGGGIDVAVSAHGAGVPVGGVRIVHPEPADRAATTVDGLAHDGAVLVRSALGGSSRNSDGGLSGWGVCLAVLGAVGMALLLAVFLAAVARVVAPGVPGVGRPATSPRAPPFRPVGLRLATVSVLRR